MARKKTPKIKVVKTRKAPESTLLKLPFFSRPGLLDELKDPDFAAYHLSASFEEKGLEQFLRALGDVVKAFGGVSRLARKTGLGRQNLYNMLSPKGNPTVKNLVVILDHLGFGISFYPRKEAA